MSSTPEPWSPLELESCRQVLTKLIQGEKPIGDPEVVDILRMAAQLLRVAKKEQRRQSRNRDEELLDGTAIRDGLLAVKTLNCDAHPIAPLPTLSQPRACYICKQPYNQVHPFYDCLCPPCAEFNLSKRNQTADLQGRFALVTGARVKIGFQIALKLLRAGAVVLATTRFPQDAARRFAAQPDAEDWADRLSIHGLDLRHLRAVEAFAGAVTQTQPHLDILIQNAAQTVRRPPAFYEHLLQGERSDGADLPCLARQMLRPSLIDWTASAPSLLPGSETIDPIGKVLATISPSAAWAELTQLPLLPGDDRRDPICFPPNQLDADAQQVDRRASNSWGLELGTVSTIELLEVQAVNSLAPFLLLRGLEPLLRAGPERDRYVVLVSAVEGQFETRWKGGRHPHTNMAKAALNMIVRTCAEPYAAERIYLTSVDTGWVTNEAAFPAAERMRAEGFRPPLDVEDGAARVLDPIFSGINTGSNLHGVFLKDYRPAAW